MHIFSIKFFNTNFNGRPILLESAEDISPMPFWARMNNSTSEMFLFLSRLFTEKTEKGHNQGCCENNYYGWIYHKNNGLAGVVICDSDYDKRIAFTLIQKYMSYYESVPENWAWRMIDKDNNTYDQKLKIMLDDYQNPQKIDQITNINKTLSDTKIIMHESIDNMLARGEKMDVLVDKSSDLSRKSKQFLKKSKKLNSWCNSCSIS